MIECSCDAMKHSYRRRVLVRFDLGDHAGITTYTLGQFIHSETLEQPSVPDTSTNLRIYTPFSLCARFAGHLALISCR